MTKSQKLALFLLRISTGWLMFYAGITKILNPEWSAAGYLKGAKTFTGLFQWFASPAMLPITDFINEWGLTLLGASLILGIGVRLSSWLGAALMLLYYFPILDGLKPNAHSFIVDEHVIYFFALIVMATLRAGRVYGLENWCANLPICRKFPKLRNLLG